MWLYITLSVNYLCVCLCRVVCVCVCVVYTCVTVCKHSGCPCSSRAGLLFSPSIALYLPAVRLCLWLSQKFIVLARLSGQELARYAWICSLVLELQAEESCPVFKVGSEDSNSHPHVCITVTFRWWTISLVPKSFLSVISHAYIYIPDE